MRKLIMLAMVLGLLVSGCVKTTFVKSITVVKDADGKIIRTEITESISQPDQQGWPVKFEYLKGIQPGN